MTSGQKFRKLLDNERPLQIIGVINSYIALLAEQAGFQALYLSGSGISTFCHGLPDLGAISREQVVDEALKITASTPLPLLVDIDTGYGSPLALKHAITLLEKVGVAAVHLEDQEGMKRCGHRPGKTLCSIEEMEGRIHAATSARSDESFVIMARTDSIAVEGIDRALERAKRYLHAGADMLFVEAVENPEDYLKFKELGAPILANMTEFGKTPLLSRDELKEFGVDMALYPLSIARLMNFSALQGLKAIKEKGSQKELLEQMQTRQELYQTINYETHEANQWEK